MEARNIIRDLGGASAVAKDLSVGRSAVSMWSVAGIPAKYWLSLKRLAETKGKQEITLEVLERHTAPRRSSTDAHVTPVGAA
jgi:hypothetical protein